MEQVIVIALDHSAQAESAVKCETNVQIVGFIAPACDLVYLERVHRPGNKVVLVHCVELPEMSINNARDNHMSPGVLASMWKEEEIRTKALEEKMTNLLKEKGVPGKLRTSSGKPGEVICSIAEEENAAMIITGMHGMGKMKRTILGSVSDYLVSHAVCPVLICRDPAEMERRRNVSGDPKLRHGADDLVNSITANLRQRFASGGKSRSQAGSGAEKEARSVKEKKENQDPKVADAKDSNENKS